MNALDDVERSILSTMAHGTHPITGARLPLGVPPSAVQAFPPPQIVVAGYLTYGHTVWQNPGVDSEGVGPGGIIEYNALSFGDTVGQAIGYLVPPFVASSFTNDATYVLGQQYVNSGQGPITSFADGSVAGFAVVAIARANGTQTIAPTGFQLGASVSFVVPPGDSGYAGETHTVEIWGGAVSGQPIQWSAATSTDGFGAAAYAVGNVTGALSGGNTEAHGSGTVNELSFGGVDSRLVMFQSKYIWVGAIAGFALT